MLGFGRKVGIAMTVIGLLRVFVGLFISTTADNREEFLRMSRDYLGSKLPGEAIDQGLIIVVAGIALYALCKIAQKADAA